MECRVGALTEKQKMAVASELSKKMSSSAVHKPLTVDVLGVLEEMGEYTITTVC